MKVDSRDLKHDILLIFEFQGLGRVATTTVTFPEVNYFEQGSRKYD